MSENQQTRTHRKPRTKTSPKPEAVEAVSEVSANGDDTPPIERIGDLIDRYTPEREAPPEPEVGSEADQYQAKPGVVGMDTFESMISGILGITGAAAGLATLHNSPTLPTFKPACAEFYQVCLDVPQLNFMIQPENKTMQAAITIGAFVVPVGRGCIMEVQRKRHLKTMAKPDARQAANENEAEEPEPGETAPEDPEAAENVSYIPDAA